MGAAVAACWRDAAINDQQGRACRHLSTVPSKLCCGPDSHNSDDSSQRDRTRGRWILETQLYDGDAKALRTDLGLLSEEYDVTAKRLVGNFPQGFSHIALLTTAHRLGRLAKAAKHRSMP